MNLQIRLRFKLGGFDADGMQIRLSRGLLSQQDQGPFSSRAPVVIWPFEAQWCQFWQDVDPISVWSWLPEYLNPNVLDGTQWFLSLSLPKPRQTQNEMRRQQ